MSYRDKDFLHVSAGLTAGTDLLFCSVGHPHALFPTPFHVRIPFFFLMTSLSFASYYLSAAPAFKLHYHLGISSEKACD